MKIAFFEIEDWEQTYLQQKLKGHKLLFFKDALSEKTVNLAKDAGIVSVFIYCKITDNVLSEFTHLQALVTRSTGYDHIDVASCKKRKIAVLNVPTYGENTVAEHTFSLLLSLSRKIPQSYERTRMGNFSLEGLRGFDLQGKTLGIIGMGHIGQHVARIARGFAMHVLAYDKYPDRNLAKKMRFAYAPLSKVLQQSDIVTLHCPYTKDTHHLLNRKTIAQMKRGAILVNTARGALVETNALVNALSRGHLGGAALDVLEQESLIKEEAQLLSKNFPKEHLQNLLENHILLTFNNVIVTPHNAFNSTEALQRILDTTLENINSVLFHKPSKNQL